jgi:hypothetical protein
MRVPNVVIRAQPRDLLFLARVRGNCRVSSHKPVVLGERGASSQPERDAITSTHAVEISVETRSPAKCDISERLRNLQPFSHVARISAVPARGYGWSTSTHSLASCSRRQNRMFRHLHRFAAHSLQMSIHACISPPQLVLITRYPLQALSCRPFDPLTRAQAKSIVRRGSSVTQISAFAAKP